MIKAGGGRVSVHDGRGLTRSNSAKEDHVPTGHDIVFTAIRITATEPAVD